MNSLELPPSFWDITYNSEIIPGHIDALSMKNGANCQVFAYNILSYFGKKIPPFRSSELWEDNIYTKRTDTFDLLDLLLFHKEPKSYGAHVAICIGEDKIIHLSKQIGRPVIWKLEDFLSNPQYKYFIGAKQVLPQPQ